MGTFGACAAELRGCPLSGTTSRTSSLVECRIIPSSYLAQSRWPGFPLPRADHKTLGSPRHRHIEVLSVELVNIQHYRHIRLKALQQEGAPHRSLWERSSEQATLFPHLNRRLLEVQIIRAPAALLRPKTCAEDRRPVRANPSILVDLDQQVGHAIKRGSFGKANCCRLDLVRFLSRTATADGIDASK